MLIFYIFCQITQVNRSALVHLRRDYEQDMLSVISLSDFVDFRPSSPLELKRPATIKLPLPEIEGDLPTEEVAVMERIDGEWKYLDTPLKFTKTSITFETRTLGWYIYCTLYSNIIH